MYRQVSGNNSPNTSLRRRFKHFLFFCLLSPSMLYAVGTKNDIAFVGASITAGMGDPWATLRGKTKEELRKMQEKKLEKEEAESYGFHQPSSYYFEQISHKNSVSINNYSPVKNPNGLFRIMMNPVDRLAEQINKAAQSTPKVIIAIDALFWVVYHSKKNGLERLEKALKVMAETEQNFVISLLPSIPIETPLGKMELSPKIIDEVNRRLKEWSQDQNEQNAQQGKVLLLNLSSFYKDEEFNCGAQLGNKTRSEIMAKDKIHLTKFGHLCLAGRLLEDMSQSHLSQFNFVASHLNSTKLHDLSGKPSHRHDEH